ncbi:MAG: biosynthetic arginine decarboxylase, partial [Planctomycetes bacterium]|nr:biosynthetic arginine decarboxylase [Planctomycetota bacterium]
YACVSPEPGDPAIRLVDVVDAMRARGYRSPFLLRFPQILRNRVVRLHAAFQAAIEEFEYPERYQGVYPVKVNQQRVVVESLVEESAAHRYGLEVGSKGELVLALTQDLDEEAYIVCNGFKDRDFIELALRAEKSDRRVLIICETLTEVGEVLEIAGEIDVRPRLGVRVRLHSQGAGKWVESGGDRAKFGLSTLEILECMELLERAGQPDVLQCLHFHVGSQISDILAIKEAVKEAARLYCHIRRRAHGLALIDLGGGLGIDYDGSSTASDWSRNYTLEEYCRDCVWNVLSVCQQEDVPPPRLMSETGRAVTAFGTVVVVSPLKVIGRTAESPIVMPPAPCHQVVELQVALDDMTPSTWREMVNDARALKDEGISAFKMGFVSLEDRAAGEALFSDVCRRALTMLDPEVEDDEEVAEIMQTVAPMLVCNFSVFQSVPDIWAFRQVFPIMPLSMLHEETLEPFTLGDITCDSDGRIDDFLSEVGAGQHTIRLPAIDLDHPYCIGIFLVGAYQDTLGDFHNLFGSANEVSVLIDGDGGFRLVGHHRGTTVSQAVSLFGFPREELVHRFDDRHGGDDSNDTTRYRDCFLRVLSSGTYLRR